MCGGVVITSGDRYRVKIQTDNLPVARKCFTLLQKIFNIEPEVFDPTASEAAEDQDLQRSGAEDMRMSLRVLQALKLIDGTYGDPGKPHRCG